MNGIHNLQSSRRLLRTALATTALSALASVSNAYYDEIPPQTFARMCPTHVEGDREFNGNGPEVYTSLYLLYDPELGVELFAYMNQTETRGDRSEAELLTVRKIAPPRSDGEEYTHVWKPDTRGVYDWRPISDRIDLFSDRYEDGDTQPRTLHPTNFWLQEVTTNGDTQGNDIGSCTSDDAYLTVRTSIMYLGYLCSGDDC